MPGRNGFARSCPAISAAARVYLHRSCGDGGAPRLSKSSGRGEAMNEHVPFVGRPIQRVEDLRLLRGKGRYVDVSSVRDSCMRRFCAARSRTGFFGRLIRARRGRFLAFMRSSPLPISAASFHIFRSGCFPTRR